MTAWLVRSWVAGALMIAVALLALVPLVADAWSLPVLLIYLHSPGYMLHQVEEHWGDRFRTFVNQRMFAGVEALTPGDVVGVNVGQVWTINVSALYAARFLDPGWALISPFAMVVNALVHIVSMVRFGGYNPGLATGFVLFLPLGLFSLYTIPATAIQHAFGLGAAIGLHILIAINAARRAAKARRAAF